MSHGAFRGTTKLENGLEAVDVGTLARQAYCAAGSTRTSNCMRSC